MLGVSLLPRLTNCRTQSHGRPEHPPQGSKDNGPHFCLKHPEPSCLTASLIPQGLLQPSLPLDPASSLHPTQPTTSRPQISSLHLKISGVSSSSAHFPWLLWKRGPFLLIGVHAPLLLSPPGRSLLISLYTGCFSLAVTPVFPTPKKVFPPL